MAKDHYMFCEDEPDELIHLKLFALRAPDGIAKKCYQQQKEIERLKAELNQIKNCTCYQEYNFDCSECPR